MAFETGQRIGDYQVLEVLGAGGMGQVYKVRNVISERLEAMKVLLPNLAGDPELADRFMREIKVQASLSHPNIAGLHTAFRLDNQLLMLMEFIEGSTLESLMRERPIPLEQGIEYISQVLAALGYAHEHGVVHRDIKPANMMLTPKGVVKLMDFGIARIEADRKLTQTGKTVGSLYYMSPEQINGAALDARSDLYSLGVSLYEVVTGRRPFQGDSDYSIMAAHLNSAPVQPIQIDPNLPGPLNDIIMMSIAKDPAQRFQSAKAFRAALSNVVKIQPPTVSHPIQVPRLNPLPQPAPVQQQPQAVEPRSRRGLYMAVGSLATVAVIVLAAVQGPKLFKSSGAASQSSTAQTSASQIPSQTLQPPYSSTQTAPTQSTQQPALSTQTQPLVPETKSSSPNTVEKRASQTAPVEVAQRPPAVREAVGVPNVPATPLAQQQTPPVSTPSAPVNNASPAEIGERREVLMMLGTRANSIKQSLDTLRQQQARSGLSLRADIVSTQQRMEYHLDEAEGSLRAGDPSKAKKSLDSAEREIEKLEKFLGH